LARPRVRFRADDIWDAPDDGNRYEIMDGELYVTPAADWSHQLALGNLFAPIWSYVHQHNLGYVVQAPMGVALDPESGVEPDLVFVSRERSAIISKRGVEGAPDLVAEALSPSTAAQDRGIRMRRYAAAGIPHYWILDLRAHTLDAYRLGPDGYTAFGTFGSDQVFHPELFSGLEIAVGALWT